MNSKFVLLFLIILNFGQLIFTQKLILSKEDCKCKVQTSKRLLGGEVSIPNAYPFHVSLSKKSKANESFCAGIIVNHNQILTKGRCVLEKNLDIKNTIIRAGVHDLNSTDGEIYTIKKVYRDSRYTEDDFYSIGDIALIEVKETIKFTDGIQPACLATKFEHYDNRKGSLTIIGWNPKSAKYFFPNVGILKEALANYERKLPQLNVDCERFLCFRAIKKGHITNAGDGGSGIIHTKNGISRVVGISRFTSLETIAGASRISFYKPELDKWTENNYCSGNV